MGLSRWRVDLKALVMTDPDKEKCTEDIMLTKVDTKEMIQVSVHDQVKMNASRTGKRICRRDNR